MDIHPHYFEVSIMHYVVIISCIVSILSGFMAVAEFKTAESLRTGSFKILMLTFPLSFLHTFKLTDWQLSDYLWINWPTFGLMQWGFLHLSFSIVVTIMHVLIIRHIVK